jgi:dihydrofolate reductase
MLVAEMAMSLDGFVADADDGMLRLEPRDAAPPGEVVGAVICGRRSFDITGGWCGHHPLDAPVFVVTHSVPYGWPKDGVPVEFVTDGIESALDRARAGAGGGTVAVASPSLAQQYLDAGLLDRIRVTVVPVLLGDGVRFFGRLAHAPILLEGVNVVEGRDVTHLTYRVRKASVGAGRRVSARDEAGGSLVV